jgi:acetyl esterase
VSAPRAALHPQALAFYEQAAELAAPPIWELGPRLARAGASAAAAAAGAGPDVAEVRELEIPARDGAALAARLYRPHGARGTIVWFHGGGWVLDGLELADATCRLLAIEAAASVVAVDYRPAPEHRFPVALDDCHDTLLWVAEQPDAGPIVLGGDSAGGNLAAVCALRAARAGTPAVIAQVLVYPVTDSDLDTPSYLEHGDPQLPLLTREAMAWFFDQYARDQSDLANPELAPLRTLDLSHAPPAIVIVAEHDPLRDDGLRYAERLRDAGVAVELHHYEDMPHGFFLRARLFDTGDAAVRRVGARLAQLIAAVEA